ncbi:hypothetical protein AB4Y32_15335 [Paraburkholderia phymatum]|uniref:Uncharacterized protein n=1 Tax=Paraburkholderia phymatum TaxID=148447 RepID=A0ACC6U0I3_9BURK
MLTDNGAQIRRCTAGTEFIALHHHSRVKVNDVIQHWLDADINDA